MAGEGTAAPRVSVVLPTYNEAGSVGTVLGRLDRTFTEAGVAWEAVVVDDDSPDGTAQVAREAGERLTGEVRVVVRTDERGLGSAVVRGMREACAPYVCVMDADGQHPTDAVVRMLATAESDDADLVIGSRHTEGGSSGDFAWHRRLVSWGAGLAAKIALPAVRQNRLTDPMSGLFLLRRSCIEGVDLKPKGYKILLDVLVRARPAQGRRLEIREVGYTFGSREAGDSKLGAGVAVAFLWHLLMVALVDRENRRTAKFLAVGASGIPVNLAVVWVGGHYFGATMGLAFLAAAVVGRLAAIGSNFLLNDLITFKDRRGETGHRFFVRYAQVHVVSAVSFAVYAAVAFGLERLGVHYLLATFIAILVSFIINLRGYADWVYRPKRRRESPDASSQGGH